MICPVCHEPHVAFLEGIFSPWGWRPHIDPYTGVHYHDTNFYTGEYQCAAGHTWKVKHYGSCWCGWTHKEDQLEIGR